MADDPFDPLPTIPAGVETSRYLDVSGRSTVVSTVDLEVAADQLARLSGRAAAHAAGLRALESPWSGATSARQAQLDIEAGIHRLDDIAHRAQLLTILLRTAAQGYMIVDRVVAAGVRAMTVEAANRWAHLVPTMILLSGPVVPTAAITLWLGLRAVVGSGALTFGPSDSPKPSAAAAPGFDPLNNAATVSGIRTLTGMLGPFLLGTAGVPVIPGTSRQSFDVGARSLVGAGRSVGLFEETPVRLVETRALDTQGPPSSYADRLTRIPNDDGPGPQVVIEKYAVAGEPARYEVYIGPTATFSPVSTTEPWDMTSNMTNATGEQSASVAAVRVAMTAAGIDETSPVQFAGYSQGGGTAARLAASGLYNTQGLVTFAGPTGQIALPDTFPAVLVEHADDLVPALGGEQDNRGAVLVRRDVFHGDDVPDMPVPAHHIEYYLQTAQLMDASGSPQLDSTIASLNRFIDGAVMESRTAYRLERVPPDG